MTDNQTLLAEYARTGSDAAFRELVTCYVDLVHSTALRLVEGDTHRAEDVTQTVFVDLARSAQTLAGDVKLGGWLHRHTCFVTSTVLRGERRRQSRERQATEMNALQNHSEADYSLVAPLLDEAINELGEADRTAILLRFFEKQDFRAVGQALGSNEDAARMRVTRALEKLEEFLKRRGITTTAASLGVLLTATAVQAAPAGLVVTISTAAALAGTTLTATATTTAIKTIAMTTFQKTVITATLAIVAGAGIYEARQASRLRDQVQMLQEQQAPMAEQLQQLHRGYDEATNRLAALRDDNERLNRNTAELLKLRSEATRFRNGSPVDLQGKAASLPGTNDSLEVVMKLRVDAVNRLKQRFEKMPEKKIPELQLLTAEDWLDVGQHYAEDERGSNFGRVAADLRRAAKQRFANLAGQALNDYILANNGELPAAITQLKPYLGAQVSETMLLRYDLLHAGKLSALPISETIIAEKAGVDNQDTLFEIGAYGWKWSGTGPLMEATVEGSWDTSRIKAYMKQ